MSRAARVVRADFTHLQRITEIYNHAILHSTATFDTEPKSLQDRAEWLHAHGDAYPVFVALDGNDIVQAWGSLSAWSERLAYKITAEPSIYVDEAVRKQGYGTALMERLIEEARRIGYHSLISRIADANASSLQLHERFGFEKIGHLKEVGRKFNRLLDVVFYQKMLVRNA